MTRGAAMQRTREPEKMSRADRSSYDSWRGSRAACAPTIAALFCPPPPPSNSQHRRTSTTSTSRYAERRDDDVCRHTACTWRVQWAPLAPEFCSRSCGLSVRIGMMIDSMGQFGEGNQRQRAGNRPAHSWHHHVGFPLGPAAAGGDHRGSWPDPRCRLPGARSRFPRPPSAEASVGAGGATRSRGALRMDPSAAMGGGVGTGWSGAQPRRTALRHRSGGSVSVRQADHRLRVE